MENRQHIGIALLPPVPGTCPVCAVAHEKEAPHNRDSLYYQYKFYFRHGHFPTWGDAMAHCSDAVKTDWRAELQKRGVSWEQLEVSLTDEERRLDQSQ